VHATVLAALGLDPARELTSSAGRPLKLSEGTPIARLVDV
jgi:glutamate mutase epsilon subunit